MSAEEEQPIGQIDISMMSEMLQEPMYLSELARRMQALELPYNYDKGQVPSDGGYKTWDEVSEGQALVSVMWGISALVGGDESGQYEVFEQIYDSEDDSNPGESQSVGSPHYTLTNDDDPITNEWKPYSIVHNTGGKNAGESLQEEGYTDKASRMRKNIDRSISTEEKAEKALELSRLGNDVSRNAESIMQDVFQRQFREYEETRVEDYNDPGIDFAVVDSDRRDYGLLIEVSTRWVNPIGKSYVKSKLGHALDLEETGDDLQPWDIVILAPKFTQSVKDDFEADYITNPEQSMVNLFEVPSDRPGTLQPYATSPEDIQDRKSEGGGNPVIVPDSQKVRDLARKTGNIGDEYPVVDDNFDAFIRSLDEVYRQYEVVTESRYRNMLREAVEPLLWEFMRPYKIEQFLIDMYWDRGLNQSQIGRLVDRSGSTIGSWMREFGVMRRGTGAPELSQETKEVWRRMYEGEDPFPQQFSGYRIQAEYNRHPLWGLQDWKEWYQRSTENERKKVSGMQNSFRNELDYTILVGANDRLTPSYSFILKTLKDMGVEVRAPDEAPRVPYSAYPSRGALEYMINKDEDTIVEVDEENGDDQ